MVSPAHFVALSVILFVIGGVGVLVRRNALVVFMCVELMLNAANLAFVAFARMHGALDGQVIAQCEERYGARVKVLDHPVLGPLTAKQWRKFHLIHGRHHVRQISRLKATMSRS